MNENVILQFNPISCIASKIQKSNRVINNIFRKHLRFSGLTNSQISILFVLSKRKIITQSKLGDMLFLEKSTVHRNIRRLVEDELLVINNKKAIEITPKGLNKVITIIPIWEAAMAETQAILGDDGCMALDQLFESLTL